ncbi:MAG TPA: TlpA disulfide reductase family protein [Chloroflexota bacterium]|nr:TlpA disulfide reductase family protein [Chloroflexota bacterium]
MAAAARPLAALPRRGILLFAPVAVVGTVILVVLGLTLARGNTAVRTDRLIGQQAPAFTMTTFEGTKVSLASLRGKPVLLNFWGSWCIPCKDEAPVLSQAWQKYQGKVQFVGLALWDQSTAAQTFARQNGATWLNGMDNSGTVAIDFGVYGVPESYFISRSGVLVQRFPGPFVGASGAAQLSHDLQALSVAP